MNVRPMTAPKGDRVDQGSRPVEVVIHLNERLDQEQRTRLVEAITTGGEVCSAEFCQLRDHLLLVRYDRRKINSLGVLNRIARQRYRAQLVGPI